MTTYERQAELSFDPRGLVEPVGAEPDRNAERAQTVRIVEYVAFPRCQRDERPQIAFTRDLSDTGLCLGVEVAEEPGSLLRIVVHSVDGTRERDVLARVGWCAPRGKGRHWIGLATIDSPRAEMRLVRRSGGELRVTA